MRESLQVYMSLFTLHDPKHIMSQHTSMSSRQSERQVQFLSVEDFHQ